VYGGSTKKNCVFFVLVLFYQGEAILPAKIQFFLERGNCRNPVSYGLGIPARTKPPAILAFPDQAGPFSDHATASRAVAKQAQKSPLMLRRRFPLKLLFHPRPADAK
jgi:hypothetical protein